MSSQARGFGRARAIFLFGHVEQHEFSIDPFRNRLSASCVTVRDDDSGARLCKCFRYRRADARAAAGDECCLVF